MPHEHRYITSPGIKPAKHFSAIAGDLVFWRPGWDEENDLCVRAGIVYGELKILLWLSSLGGLTAALLVGWSTRTLHYPIVKIGLFTLVFFIARYIIAKALWSHYKRKEWNRT